MILTDVSLNGGYQRCICHHVYGYQSICHHVYHHAPRSKRIGVGTDAVCHAHTICHHVCHHTSIGTSTTHMQHQLHTCNIKYTLATSQSKHHASEDLSTHQRKVEQRDAVKQTCFPAFLGVGKRLSWRPSGPSTQISKVAVGLRLWTCGDKDKWACWRDSTDLIDLTDSTVVDDI